MNIFKRWYAVIAPEINRFPGVLISTVIALTASGISLFRFPSPAPGSAEALYWTQAAWFAIPFSTFISLLFEYIFADRLEEPRFKKARLIIQCAGVLLCIVPVYFMCRLDSQRVWVIYVCLIAAMIVMCGFFLEKSQRFEDVVPSIIVSGLIALIEMTCVALGILVILWAFGTLVFSVSGQAFTFAAIFSFLIIFVNVFLVYSTRPSGTFKIPKLFRLIVKRILFSLYIVLIAVLYIYLIKMLFSKTMPNGRINWFVSFATVFYLFFQLTLRNYQDEKLVSFFYKNGHLFLIPLVVIQCLSFGIRVNAYGFTMMRYASLLYIIFSIVVLILASFKSGALIRFVYPVFAGILLVASLTPLSLSDVPRINQIHRIERVYKAHGMFSEEKLNPVNADIIFSPREKEIVCSAYDFLIAETKLPEWASGFKTKPFQNIFGFNHVRYDSHQKPSVSLEGYTAKKIDVSQYSALYTVPHFQYVLDSEEPPKKCVIFDSAGNRYDITEQILSFIENLSFEENTSRVIDAVGGEPVLHIDSETDLVLTDLDISKGAAYISLSGWAFIAKK